MNSCDFDTFCRLAEDHNVIPMVRERLGDFDTPVSLAAKLCPEERFFILESVEGGEKWGRYSILGFDIRRALVVTDNQAVLRTAEGDRPLPGNPIDAIQRELACYRLAHLPGLPRFYGGAVGYFSFESVRFFERCGAVKPPLTEGFDDVHLFLADDLAVFDTLSHTVKLIHCVHTGQFDTLEADFSAGLAALDAAESMLFAAPPLRAAQPPPASSCAEVPMTSNMSRDAFESMVRRGKEYVCQGDIIQVVLAQHFSGTIHCSHLDVYRALRYINPSPYIFYLKLDQERAIVGSSPEMMARFSDGIAEIRPIAGTRPRGATDAEDLALAEDLLGDPKERAEHVMLVDLARNDLGRIAETGTVNVRDYMVIERYSHVMHIVSHVEAKVRAELDGIDVFKASFPAGTLSGAPKVRAMEIINELEPHGRGPYGGALGYIAYGGKLMDTAITIRTLVLNGTSATVTAGAGIVYDSVPAKEFEETQHKSRGMKRALEMAENGLRL